MLRIGLAAWSGATVAVALVAAVVALAGPSTTVVEAPISVTALVVAAVAAGAALAGLIAAARGFSAAMFAGAAAAVLAWLFAAGPLAILHAEAWVFTVQGRSDLDAMAAPMLDAAVAATAIGSLGGPLSALVGAEAAAVAAFARSQTDREPTGTILLAPAASLAAVRAVVYYTAAIVGIQVITDLFHIPEIPVAEWWWGTWAEIAASLVYAAWIVAALRLNAGRAGRGWRVSGTPCVVTVLLVLCGMAAPCLGVMSVAHWFRFEAFLWCALLAAVLASIAAVLRWAPPPSWYGSPGPADVAGAVLLFAPAWWSARGVNGMKEAFSGALVAMIPVIRGGGPRPDPDALVVSVLVANAREIWLDLAFGVLVFVPMVSIQAVLERRRFAAGLRPPSTAPGERAEPGVWTT